VWKQIAAKNGERVVVAPQFDRSTTPLLDESNAPLMVEEMEPSPREDRPTTTIQ